MPLRSSKTPPANPGGRWRLQDAKARLSEVVRDAQTKGPQHVTLHGRDAAVIVSAEDYERSRTPTTGLDLIAALADSPLQNVDFERVSFKAPVRDISL